MQARTRIMNGRVFTPSPTEANEITLIGGRILCIDKAPDHKPPDVTVDAHGGYIVPGLIDALVHGGGGSEAMSGDADEVRTIARSHGSFGTTSMCIGTVASPMEKLSTVLGAIAEVTNHHTDDGARVLGAYVEGLLGCHEKRGAHATEYLRKPTVEIFQSLWTAAAGTLRVLSYAPESDDRLTLTHYLSDRQDELSNVVPAMGHTNATYDEARRSIDAGIRRATHLFNGMSGLHHRRLGAAEAILDDPRVHAELIGDGVHVAPPWARLAMKLKTSANLGLITDAHGGAALSEEDVERFFKRDQVSGGLVSRDGRGLYLRDGAIYMHPTEDFLGGSIITLADAVRNAIQWGASIEDALRMATEAPAKNLCLRQKGQLSVGFDADVVVFDANWHAQAVFVEGRAIKNDLSATRCP